MALLALGPRRRRAVRVPRRVDPLVGHEAASARQLTGACHRDARRPRVGAGRGGDPVRVPWATLKNEHFSSALIPQGELFVGGKDKTGASSATLYVQGAIPAEVSWPAGRESVRALSRWADERDVRYLAVLIPARWQVQDDAWESYRRLWGRPDDAFDRDRAQRVVIEQLGADGVEVLDLLAPLREAAAKGARSYYEVDAHWTATGHDLAARAIHAHLRELGWIGSESGRAVVKAPTRPGAG